MNFIEGTCCSPIPYYNKQAQNYRGDVEIITGDTHTWTSSNLITGGVGVTRVNATDITGISQPIFIFDLTEIDLYNGGVPPIINANNGATVTNNGTPLFIAPYNPITFPYPTRGYDVTWSVPRQSSGSVTVSITSNILYMPPSIINIISTNSNYDNVLNTQTINIIFTDGITQGDVNPIAIQFVIYYGFSSSSPATLSSADIITLFQDKLGTNAQTQLLPIEYALINKLMPTNTALLLNDNEYLNTVDGFREKGIVSNLHFTAAGYTLLFLFTISNDQWTSPNGQSCSVYGH
jgi:hypothetical protein